MAGLKLFVQQAVRALEQPQLQLLSEALRVDLRSCDERADVERVLTGLLCLDQDSSLGVFLSWWLSLNQQSLGARKPFQTTFVPAISSPGRGISSGNNQHVVDAVVRAGTPEEERMPEHHLDDEIRERLGELEVLERDFKVAERGVHTGSPSLDKLKMFLVALAQLRHKEEETRRFLLRQAKLLCTQHDDMQRETLHTRGQLDFFVAGFTNLRRRHDALLDKATRLAAENESAHALFVEMSAEDAHFAVLASNTLQKQLADIQELRDKVKDRDDRLDKMKAKQEELLQTISGLKQQWGDARKDAHCFKQQLRVCKSRMREMEQAATDAKFLRKQASELRHSVAMLLSVHLRDAIQRDTKSAKQTLSKETLRIVQRITAASDDNVEDNGAAEESGENDTDKDQERTLTPSRKRPLMPGASASPGSKTGKPALVGRKNLRDVDEVVKGVLLVGGADNEAETCAKMLAEKLKYLPVDMTAALKAIRKDEELAMASGVAAATADTTLSAAISSTAYAIATPLVTIARYATHLSSFIRSQLALERKRAFVLFNWSFSGSDVDWLKAAGLPIDSILDLQVAPPSPPRSPAPLSRQVQQPSTAASSSSPTARAPGTPSRAPTASSPSRGKQAVTATASTSNGTAKISPPKSPTKTPTSPSAKPSVRAAKGATTSSTSSTTAESKQQPQTKGSSPVKSPAKSPAISPAKSPAKAPAKPPSRATDPNARSTSSPKKSLEPKNPGASPSRPPTSSSKAPSGPLTASKPNSASRQAATPIGAGGAPVPTHQQQQSNRPIDHRVTFRTQLQVFQSIALTEFVEDRIAAIVSALEREKTRRLMSVIKWDEVTQRTQEQLAMFGEEVLTLLVIEQENRKPAAKKTPGTNSTASLSTSSSVATSRGASRSSSRAASPTKEKKSTAATTPTARGGRSPTASDKKPVTSAAKPASPVRRAIEVVANSSAKSPQAPARRLTQQVSAPSPSKLGKAAR